VEKIKPIETGIIFLQQPKEGSNFAKPENLP
jgi:hypothetical protein